MKKTALHQLHLDAGAKMGEFAGFDMPIEYVGISAEHRNVRERVGIFDVAHMGDIYVQGPRAEEFMQRVGTNDVSRLEVGDVQYNCFPNPQGGIKDDFLTYRLAPEQYLLVVNAGNFDKDWAWLQEQVEAFGTGVELVDANEDLGQIAVQGPEAMRVVQRIFAKPVDDLKFYTWRRVPLKEGGQECLVSITGYTGAGGCEIYAHPDVLVRIWTMLLEAGQAEGIMPCGLGARDTLRLEMGFCLYGHEINEETCPIEAGLGWITKLIDEKKDMIGRALIEKMRVDKPQRKLVGFVLETKGIPRQGYRILNEDGKEIGVVTSGTMSPMMRKGIGMGYVASEYAKPDTVIRIEVRDHPLPARVVKMPIYKAD